MTSIKNLPVFGRVFSTNTRTFTFGARVSPGASPEIGAFVKTEPFESSLGHITVVGVVCQVKCEGDSGVRALSASDQVVTETEVEWQRNRHVPIEVKVIPLGYYVQRPEDVVYGYIPLPPPILKPVWLCDDDEVRALTKTPDFLRGILDTKETPDVNSVIHAVIDRAARVHAKPSDFKRQCGRMIVRRLGDDPQRAEDILYRLSL